VNEFLAYTFVGLLYGSAYAIAASGIVLTYTTTRVFNIGQGAVSMLMAYIYWQLKVSEGLPTWLALVLVLFVIAPAIGSWLTRWTNDESAHDEARRHLDDTVTALARAGITARGQTGDDDPLQAADDGLRDFAADEIMFVTKPGTNTDWLEKGVVEAARKRYPLPVSHIALPAG